MVSDRCKSERSARFFYFLDLVWVVRLFDFVVLKRRGHMGVAAIDAHSLE